MSKTPWIDKKSLLDITRDRGAKGLQPIDMGFIYVFKNGESKHFLDDSEAYRFYEEYKEKLNTEPE